MKLLKRILALSFALMFCAMAFPTSLAASKTYFITTKRAPIREDPWEEASPTWVEKGTLLEATCSTRNHRFNKWYSVRTVDKTGKPVAGWIYEKNVAKTSLRPNDIKVSKKLNVKSIEQTTNYSCAGASSRAVISYLSKNTCKKTDMQLYNEMGSINIGNIEKIIEKYTNTKYYCVRTKTLSSFQDTVIKSLNQNKPVVMLLKITDKQFFPYTTKSGHFTVVSGYEIKYNGDITFIVTDSYKTAKNGGIVRLSPADLFKYLSAHRNPYYILHG